MGKMPTPMQMVRKIAIILAPMPAIYTNKGKKVAISNHVLKEATAILAEYICIIAEENYARGWNEAGGNDDE